MKNCIYKISSILTSRLYVGSCANPIKRKSLHFRHLIRGIHCNQKLQRHFNKYGVEDLVFEIIESGIPLKYLIQVEQLYINELKPYFNLCQIAGSAIGRKHSQKTKNKISSSLKGKEYTEERRKNMSIGRKGVKPKPFTDEHKKNMSLAFNGKKKIPFTNGRKQKLSDIWKKKRELKFSTLL